MTSNIYDLHEKAFQQVSAFVVTKDGERLANIAIKFPASGHAERRLWAYIHVMGIPMVRGYADSYGYDKQSAAILSAIGKLPAIGEGDVMRADWPVACAMIDAMRACADNGRSPLDQLRDLGYSVFQAV